MQLALQLLLSAILQFHLVFSQNECDQRYFEEDSFVCVCSEDVCDVFPEVELPADGFYNIITSSRDDFRFFYANGTLNSGEILDEVDVRIYINGSDMRQSIIGFGGAFTDAAGINILALSEQLQDTLIRQYYSPTGIEYNTGRIPIAGCDFSTYPYSYDDIDGDTELVYFNLTEEDYSYKIPLIKKAQDLSERPILLFASPWSPPSWMKDNGMFNGTGSLLPEMLQPWANYFVKFLDAYGEEGITLWGLTAQNEPSGGGTIPWSWNQCHFSGEDQKEFVRDYLGPTLNASGYRYLQLIIGDDSRHIYPEFVEKVLNDTECAAYVDGIGVHWYADATTSVSILTKLHNDFPDKFLLYTEACNGELSPKPVALGSWERGESYASDIINNLNHWSTGWTDWNLALDITGGPNWANNMVDSPIIVNEESNEFYKQPMFYVMGHFSKFVPEHSRCIGTEVEILISENSTADHRLFGNHIQAVSFINTEGYTVTVILNKNEEEKVAAIEDSLGNTFTILLPQKSIQTVIY